MTPSLEALRDKLCEEAFTEWTDRLKDERLKPLFPAYRKENKDAMELWKYGFDAAASARDAEVAELKAELAAVQKVYAMNRNHIDALKEQADKLAEALEKVRKDIAEAEAELISNGTPNCAEERECLLSAFIRIDAALAAYREKK